MYRKTWYIDWCNTRRAWIHSTRPNKAKGIGLSICFAGPSVVILCFKIGSYVYRTWLLLCNRIYTEYIYVYCGVVIGKNYEIIRNKKEIILNNKKYSETNYKEFLNNEFLSQNILNQNFTFRGLFSRFSRSSEDSYIEATSQITIKENGFINNKHNSFLLGLNIEFIKKKELLKKEQNNLKSIQKELKNFDINEKDNSELLDIEDEIKSLKKELKNFQIAENYNNLQMEADLYTKNINEKSNLLFRVRKKYRMLVLSDKL